MRMRRFNPPTRTRGSTLLEVLIALLLLSGGVLSTAMLYANSMKYSKMAQIKGTAMDLALELADRMRANAAAATNNAYNFAQAYNNSAAQIAVPACANVNACTPQEIAAIDVVEMRNRVARALPGGWLQIAPDAGGGTVLNIWVMWLNPDTVGADTTDMPCPPGVADEPQCLPLRVGL